MYCFFSAWISKLTSLWDIYAQENARKSFFVFVLKLCFDRVLAIRDFCGHWDLEITHTVITCREWTRACYFVTVRWNKWTIFNSRNHWTYVIVCATTNSIYAWNFNVQTEHCLFYGQDKLFEEWRIFILNRWLSAKFLFLL